ncbi:Protein of unknown function (DUF3050) [Sphingobacterium allocomposti]|uniref:DUF3050 family protein n=1 Tax=Sphingobacterium allocomposti TaxID=415956 RepID=A0A5S5DPA7_9SPHI|nr:DUF3050 domain-containing protein [Sphingobacterium composti Yoo et al. 2007 non Ten et al. 2007]TYP97747.1 Protein of unknown function (DUF3050) [Sphingobacterium composti Yoo et al. 2007 non Ten et al. 2007]
MEKIQVLNNYIAAVREELLHHPLYQKIVDIHGLRTFTEGHVYAVWDFMSLLKALQAQLTCVKVPWFASPYPTTRYLINEIVLAEESDEYIDGRRLSHFEMYLDAMRGMGSSVGQIEGFVEIVKNGSGMEEALLLQPIDERIRDFVRFTFEVIASNEPHKIASAFTFGREDLIPDMFTSILREIQSRFPAADLSKMIYYFQRHIELDGDEHGPLAIKMIEELAGDDEQKLEEMAVVAKESLKKRLALWDAIADNIG